MRLTLAVVCAFAFACSGTIGDPAGDISPSSNDAALCNGPADPGRVTMRRLSRIEYRNTLRDLLGDDVDRIATLPADDRALGFDAIGDVLSTSINHLTAYVDNGFDAALRAMARDRARPAGTAARLLTCTPQNQDDITCFRTIVHGFAKRAFRRPLTDIEKTSLDSALTDTRADGDDFDMAVQVGVATALSSPSFIFRVEAQSGAAEAVEAIGPFELATRLSYFIWSSTPDDALLAAAENGSLKTPTVLAAEAQRLLADPRAQSLVDHFAAQWLGLGLLADAEPTAAEFDEELRAAMAGETKALFKYALEHNVPVAELFSAAYTFVNGRLAEHYGLADVSGDQFQRVALPPGRVPGVLGHASYLTGTSHPDKTSPVKRGKFVLDEVLCAPPAAPPADIDEKAGEVDPNAPKRAQLAQHRIDPTCASCHMVMDPIGLAFEGFDNLGKPRSKDEKGNVVDVVAELPEGERYAGPVPLAEALARKPETVACAVEKIATFALGRAMKRTDRCSLNAIAEQTSASAYGVTDLVVAMATSRPFTSRQTNQ
ncbi:MAG: DUF1592 domain-containing protein [Myxococcota bacterium]|nr:DUF1592 domain-containing protein [Myxococcota bacterium]